MYSVRSVVVLVFIMIFAQVVVNGQNKLEVDVSSELITTTNNSLLSHYQYSNQWGVVSPYDSAQWFLNTGLKYQFVNREKFS